jgi:hypothetical protein
MDSTRLELASSYVTGKHVPNYTTSPRRHGNTALPTITNIICLDVGNSSTKFHFPFLPTAIALRIQIVAGTARVDEPQRRRIGKMNSHFVGDVAQCIVEMRQMTAGEIADERALNFVVANAAMQPAQKKRELHERGNKYCDP